MSGTIDDLKLKIKELPITEVVGLYLPLHRKGTSTLAVCPFHDDSNPSLHVNDQKGMWHCFVDDIGGDAIRFVMLYKNLNFLESLQDICEGLGWSYRDYVHEKKKSPQLEMGRKILSKSAQLYRKLAETRNFSSFDQFIETRKITTETAAQYQLGITPKNNALTEYLNSIPEDKERQFAFQIAEQLGLVRLSKYGDGQYYDTFRERIMFPIWDQIGCVIGFTSRITRDDQKPKYLNSIDSFLFNKRELLYGIHLAKSDIRQHDAVIIVEGNMDQLALFQGGFRHCVAIMGTALSENNVIHLLRYTRNIILCLDQDSAGKKASERANILFLAQGVVPKIIELGDVKDPDEFITGQGALAFQDRLEKARPLIDLQLEELSSQNPQDPEEQLQLLKSGFELLAPLKMSLQATERIMKLAIELGLKTDSSIIVENYQQYLSQAKNIPLSIEDGAKEQKQRQETKQTTQKIALPPKVFQKIDQVFMQNIVQYPELLTHSEIGKLLDFIDNNEVKRFVGVMKEIILEIDDAEYPTVLKSIISGDDYSTELSTSIGSALWNYRPQALEPKVLDQMILDLGHRLEEEVLKQKKESLKGLQKSADTKQEEEQLLFQLLETEKCLAMLKKNSRKKSPSV